MPIIVKKAPPTSVRTPSSTSSRRSQRIGATLSWSLAVAAAGRGGTGSSRPTMAKVRQPAAQADAATSFSGAQPRRGPNWPSMPVKEDPAEKPRQKHMLSRPMRCERSASSDEQSAVSAVATLVKEARSARRSISPATGSQTAQPAFPPPAQRQAAPAMASAVQSSSAARRPRRSESRPTGAEAQSPERLPSDCMRP